MLKRPIDMLPASWVVHQNHSRDRDTAEDIERNQPFRSWGIIWHVNLGDCASYQICFGVERTERHLTEIALEHNSRKTEALSRSLRGVFKR
jgi:hypothetical protein